MCDGVVEGHRGLAGASLAQRNIGILEKAFGGQSRGRGDHPWVRHVALAFGRRAEDAAWCAHFEVNDAMAPG